MPNLVNVVIVGALLFLGLLTAFWYAAEVRSPGALEVSDASANWTEGPGGPALQLVLHIENPRRTEAQVERVDLQPWLGNGSLLPQSHASGVVVGGRSDGTVLVPVQLPPDFGSRWWGTYSGSEERASLRVEGTLHVLQSVRRQEVPFEWEATWRGDWASSLAAELSNCPVDGEAGDGEGGDGEDGDGPLASGSLCLQAADAQWTRGGLRLELTVENPTSRDATVVDATASLRLHGVAVGDGGGPGELLVPAGGQGALAVELSFDGSPLDEWWPEHAAACERSPSDLFLRLDVETEGEGGDGPDGNATAEPEDAFLEWSFGGPDLRTFLACEAGP